MFLQSLRMRCFRNLQAAEIHFCPGLNILFGKNGQGKTNLLEAIYVLANTKSFRTRHLRDCVEHRSGNFWIWGSVCRNQLQRELAISWNAGDKELRLNEKAAPILHYLGNLDTMVVSFDQLPIVRGAPDERRKFLDRGIAQVKKSYLHALAEFHRALRQRNGLLAQIRNQTARLSDLQPWELIYAEGAIGVTAERERYVHRLNQFLPEVRFSADLLQVNYVPSVRDTDAASLCKTLAAIHTQEIARARSLKGPHRDELKILIGNREIQKFGSGGQQRSAIFTLLFAAVQLYFTENNDFPVLLIDDLDAELDMSRLQTLLEHLQSGRQVFVSSSKENVLKSISCGKKWEICEGVLSGS